MRHSWGLLKSPLRRKGGEGEEGERLMFLKSLLRLRGR